MYDSSRSTIKLTQILSFYEFKFSYDNLHSSIILFQPQTNSSLNQLIFINVERQQATDLFHTLHTSRQIDMLHFMVLRTGYSIRKTNIQVLLLFSAVSVWYMFVSVKDPVLSIITMTNQEERLSNQRRYFTSLLAQMSNVLTNYEQELEPERLSKLLDRVKVRYSTLENMHCNVASADEVEEKEKMVISMR